MLAPLASSNLLNTELPLSTLAGELSEEDTVQGREDASARKWGYLATAVEDAEARLAVWAKKKKKGGFTIPGIDAPSLYPDEIWADGHSTMLSSWSFHADVVAAIAEGKTFVVRFIDSDVPQKANKGARDTAAAWDAVVQAYAGHPKVRFGDVCEDDMWTMGGYITHTADFAELAIGRKGYPYVHSFNRDSDVGGAVYAAAPGKSIAEELADPYDLMALVEDEAKACLCTVASGEGCSAAEVEYAAIMKNKGAFDLKKQVVALRAQAKSEDAEDDPDLKTSVHQRLSILKQLTTGKPEDYLPNKLYEENYDPDDWSVDVTPQYVQKAKFKMDIIHWTEDLLVPWLPPNVTLPPRKFLGDYVWDQAKSDTEYQLELLGVERPKKKKWNFDTPDGVPREM